MLAANPSLTPRQVRSILGESARPELGLLTLSPDVGRGYLRADVAATAAIRETSGDTRPHYGTAIRLGIATSPGRPSIVVADASVEVLDDLGRPVKDVFVYGSFSGSTSFSWSRAPTRTASRRSSRRRSRSRTWSRSRSTRWPIA